MDTTYPVPQKPGASNRPINFRLSYDKLPPPWLTARQRGMNGIDSHDHSATVQYWTSSTSPASIFVPTIRHFFRFLITYNMLKYYHFY